MVTILVNGIVHPDGTVTLTLPAEVPPGEHAMVVVIETKPADRTKGASDAHGERRKDTGKAKHRLALPLDTAQPRNPDQQFGREEIYGEWGR